ncbi:MAG: YigZ family protein [Taibaiella sp.]|nr:YigZ family protein [Taibaiella sp.]
MENKFSYKTLGGKGSAEFRDRGSSFIAYAAPIADVQEVKLQVQLLKKEHPKAAHHCFAYRLGNDGNLFRANDDGEPSGSAGKPILGQIDSAGLSNILIVVVRYFGGTLLGVPGLINAYRSVAADALAGIPVIEKWIEEQHTITFDYPSMNEVLHLLKQCQATIYKQELQLFCEVSAGIPVKNIAQYLPLLSEIRGVNITKQEEK